MFATIKPKSRFSEQDAEESAKSFRKAMQGRGTDEKRIIKEIISHTNSERQVVKEKYQNMYGHTLEEDLKSELNGNFEDVVIALLTPRFIYEAKCLKQAMSGVGTSEGVIIDVLCSKDTNEIMLLKKAYQDCKIFETGVSIHKLQYGNEFYFFKYMTATWKKDIKSEEDGPLGRIFRSLASADRPSGNAVDRGLAVEEAQILYNAGVGQDMGTDEVEFVRILCSRSYAQLRATFDEYNKIAGKDITDSIKKETSGNLEDALLAIVKSIRNTPAYFAERLYESMKGVGTRDNDLIRTVVSRAEVDLAEVKREYKRLYNKDLVNDLKKELNGDYEDIVVALVGSD